MVADSLTGAERARLGVIAEPEPEPTWRETQAKRAALVERDGSWDFKGERVSGCQDCGAYYIASSLRLTRDNPRLLCRTCWEAMRRG